MRFRFTQRNILAAPNGRPRGSPPCVAPGKHLEATGWCTKFYIGSIKTTPRTPRLRIRPKIHNTLSGKLPYERGPARLSLPLHNRTPYSRCRQTHPNHHKCSSPKQYSRSITKSDKLNPAVLLDINGSSAWLYRGRNRRRRL